MRWRDGLRRWRDGLRSSSPRGAGETFAVSRPSLSYYSQPENKNGPIKYFACGVGLVLFKQEAQKGKTLTKCS